MTPAKPAPSARAASPQGRRADAAERARTLDDEIGEHLQASLATGELQSAPSWGRPLDLDDGHDETPVALRMAFKILKNAGVVPPEVELMQRAAALRATLAATPDGPEADDLRRRIADAEQLVALRLERLRVTGSL